MKPLHHRFPAAVPSKLFGVGHERTRVGFPIRCDRHLDKAGGGFGQDAAAGLEVRRVLLIAAGALYQIDKSVIGAVDADDQINDQYMEQDEERHKGKDQHVCAYASGLRRFFHRVTSVPGRFNISIVIYFTKISENCQHSISQFHSDSIICISFANAYKY